MSNNHAEIIPFDKNPGETSKKFQVSTASVVYFELQAHEKGMAKMLLYENSKCQVATWR